MTEEHYVTLEEDMEDNDKEEDDKQNEEENAPTEVPLHHPKQGTTRTFDSSKTTTVRLPQIQVLLEK